MRTLFIVFIFSLVASAKTQQGFLMKSELTYSADGEEIKSEREFILPRDNKSWNTLTEPQKGIVLLGRVVKSDRKSIYLESMVINSNKADAILSTPSIAMSTNGTSEISLKNETEEVKVRLTVSETDYTSSDCSDLSVSVLDLTLRAFNIANAITTRTPDGGAHKRVEARKTSSGFAEVIEFKDFKKVFEPTHPDADKEGMVTYPNIDVQKEKDAASAAALQLKLLAKHSTCGTSSKEDGNTFYLQYAKEQRQYTFDAASDTLVFDKDQTLKLWTRRFTNGADQTFRF